jgi:hypothetical protein
MGYNIYQCKFNFICSLSWEEWDKMADFYTGKVKYIIGKWIKAPDWEEDFIGECGHGLHLAATPIFALYFNHDGKVIKCETKTEYCRTVKSPEYPFKVRCKKVKPLEEVEKLF